MNAAEGEQLGKLFSLISLKESNVLTGQDSLQAWLLLPIPVWLSLKCKIRGKTSNSTEIVAWVKPLPNLP